MKQMELSVGISPCLRLFVESLLDEIDVPNVLNIKAVPIIWGPLGLKGETASTHKMPQS